jgi:hypothetical protein
VRVQVLTAASMKMTAFCNIALCSLVEVDQFITLMMEKYTPLKCQSASMRLCGAISQKAVIFLDAFLPNEFFVILHSSLA